MKELKYKKIVPKTVVFVGIALILYSVILLLKNGYELLIEKNNKNRNIETFDSVFGGLDPAKNGVDEINTRTVDINKKIDTLLQRGGSDDIQIIKNQTAAINDAVNSINSRVNSIDGKVSQLSLRKFY